MKERIILKSLHPEEYGDLEIECLVIPNDQIGAYLETISDDKKFYAHKSGQVLAQVGKVGETVKTTLKTIVDGKEYILSEEENVVKDRDGKIDIIVTNVSSTSNEQYVVKAAKFIDTYEMASEPTQNNPKCLGWVPKYDSRLLTQIDENIIIITSWGAPVVCLKGSYIVTYNAEENDYNTLEQGAFESTYTVESQKQKRKK